jgi:hypothetical protein
LRSSVISRSAAFISAVAVATAVSRLCSRRCGGDRPSYQAVSRARQGAFGSLSYSSRPGGWRILAALRALRKGWLCGCAGAPAQNRCIEVIALAEKRIGEELERGRAELLFGDR